MSATKLGNVASAIATRLLTITGLARVYTYEPRDLDALPAASILGPVTITRTGPDEPESQLGANDWRMTYMVRLYVAHDDPEAGQTAIRSLLGQVVAAIDADRSLGGQALDASLVTADTGFSESDETHQRQLVIAECSVDVWSLL